MDSSELQHAKRPRHQRRSRNRGAVIASILVALVLIGGGGFYLAASGTLSSILHPVADYNGTGQGSVEFTINKGDIGSDIATNLNKAGVTKSYDAFYKLLLRAHPDPVFIPGVYSLKKEMSASAALAALQDSKNRLVNQVVIPEGTIMSKVFSLISAKTGIPVSDFEAAAKNPQDYGVPSQAKTLEGFLFPATYSFSPNESAKDIISTMVARCIQALNDAKVSQSNWWHVITLASLVQKEAGSVPDMYKVSRVFTNRLNPTLWPTGLLESDATVAYGSGNTNSWNTTVAERADQSDPYNTYVHPGMLYAPISNPGSAAIDAVLHPAVGKWLYFVAVNLETGETVFSETLAQHEKAVAQSQAWWQEHPNYK